MLDLDIKRWMRRRGLRHSWPGECPQGKCHPGNQVHWERDWPCQLMTEMSAGFLQTLCFNCQFVQWSSWEAGHCVGKGRSWERRQSPESYVMATRRQGRAHVWCQALQGEKHFCAWISIFACPCRKATCSWAQVQEQLVAAAPPPTSVAMDTCRFRSIATRTENGLWMTLPNNWFLSTPALEQQVQLKPTWSWASALNFSLTSAAYNVLWTPEQTQDHRCLLD